MIRKAIAIVCACVFGATLVLTCLQIPAKNRYDELCGELDTPALVEHPIDASARTFLDDVRRSWKVLAQEHPDTIAFEVAKVTGLEESVQGLVDVYTHELPGYSFFNRRRNVKEAIMAATISMVVPISVDERIYVTEGLSYIKLNEVLVEVCEDWQSGVRRTLYKKPEIGEQDAGGKRDVAPPVSLRSGTVDPALPQL